MIFYVQSDNFLLFGRTFSIKGLTLLSVIIQFSIWRPIGFCILSKIIRIFDGSIKTFDASFNLCVFKYCIPIQCFGRSKKKIATKSIWSETSASITTTTTNNKSYKHVSIANSIQLCVHKTKRNMFHFSLDLVLRILSFSFSIAMRCFVFNHPTFSHEWIQMKWN